MSGLSIGLAFGLAAAGAAVGYIGDFFVGMAKAFGGDRSHSSPVGSMLVGAFGGAVLGLAVGEGITYLGGLDEAPKATYSVTEQCKLNAPEGKAAIISQDALGNTVCTYK